MNKVAIAFSTKDRVELSKRTVEPLLQPDNFDLFWADGSNSEAGKKFPYDETAHAKIFSNVVGGADAAIVFSLTVMLQSEKKYDYVGLVENDVLLQPDWFGATMALFDQGRRAGLAVGAVSARSYEDRVLIQRDGYAVMHNLGAGMVIFSRRAAELVLKYFRTGWTLENRRIFAQLSGLDIGSWWAFGGNAHMLCADWQFDRVLAQHGLASLALTPAKCEMIGQEPPLVEQGLTLTTGPVEARRNDSVFLDYCIRIIRTRNTFRGCWGRDPDLFLRNDDGTFTIFPHQIRYLGGISRGEWKLRWAQGFGPFAFEARESDAQIEVPISGPCVFLVSGGKTGGKVRLFDAKSGYDVTLNLQPEGDSGQVMQAQVPAAISYRSIVLTALTPSVVFYGIVCREPQPFIRDISFDHTWLPEP